uniref:U-box domain-containing protein n=1 Tax=Oryza nivara TaxID=4536 RepID=A0A0E0IQ46_ORYNI
MVSPSLQEGDRSTRQEIVSVAMARIWRVRRRRGADIDIEAVRRRRELPRLASLCLREVLLVLQRFNAIVADCSVRSRMWLKASVLSLIQEIEPPAPPSDFRCPISLDLMRDPIVVASGQTYDRDSSGRWSGAERRRHPATPRGKMREEEREEGKGRVCADVVF